MIKKKPLKEKDFDCVKFMREIREKLSKDIATMSLQEENSYLNKVILQNKSKRLSVNYK